jgi:hypothetical protein
MGMCSNVYVCVYDVCRCMQKSPRVNIYLYMCVQCVCVRAAKADGDVLGFCHDDFHASLHAGRPCFCLLCVLPLYANCAAICMCT